MNLTEIGYFSRMHGIKGHLILKLQIDFCYEEVKAVFVEMGGSKAPFFVKEIAPLKDDLRVLLEDIDTIEQGGRLIGKKVFVNSDFVDEDEGQDLRGFELIDKDHGSLGLIMEVNDNGAQLLVSLQLNGKELILPLAEELIEKVDEGEKKIWYNAPDGLIDMYLK